MHALLGTLIKSGKNIIERFGDGFYKDIIGYTEASNLFTTKSHSKTLLTSLNTLLDEKREVHRTLAYGNIDYNTNVSLMLTTFPNPLVYTQLQSGFMQRCFVLYEIIGLDEYSEISKYLNAIVWKKKQQIDLTPIINRLSEIKEKQFSFSASKEIREAMNKVINEFYDLVKVFDEEHRKILKTFMTRQTILFHRLMCHHSSLELREEISLQDVKYARALTLDSYKSICRYVQDNYKVDKRYLRFQRLIHKLKQEGKNTTTLSELSARLKPIKVSEIEKIALWYQQFHGIIEVNGKTVTIK